MRRLYTLIALICLPFALSAQEISLGSGIGKYDASCDNEQICSSNSNLGYVGSFELGTRFNNFVNVGAFASAYLANADGKSVTLVKTGVQSRVYLYPVDRMSFVIGGGYAFFSESGSPDDNLYSTDLNATGPIAKIGMQFEVVRDKTNSFGLGLYVEWYYGFMFLVDTGFRYNPSVVSGGLKMNWR